MWGACSGVRDWPRMNELPGCCSIGDDSLFALIPACSLATVTRVEPLALHKRVAESVTVVGTALPDLNAVVTGDTRAVVLVAGAGSCAGALSSVILTPVLGGGSALLVNAVDSSTLTAGPSAYTLCAR